jgi:hypothetical protein
MKQIRTRLTYANVMSSIAVFLVLGGATALAASKIGANGLKANSVLTGKIKKEAVTTSKLKNESVATAKIKNGAITTGKIDADAVTGAKVNEASLGQVPSASFAVSANPEVFAQVASNGTVDPALAKGLSSANVTHPSEGVFCITVSTFTPRGGQVTPQFGGTNGTTANLTIGGTGNCPLPAVQVLTFGPGASPALGSVTFYVELYH